MRTESILQRIEELLTGLTTTGTSVQREQAYDIEQSTLPALVVNEGEDTVEQQLSQAYIDWSLVVDIDIVARGDHSTVITQINTIRGEVHTALMAAYTLAPLTYVKYVEALNTTRPVLSVEGDRPIVRQRLTYLVKYRTNWADLEE